MKKIIALTLTLLILAALSSCGKDNSDGDVTNSDTTTTVTTAPDTTTTPDTSSASGEDTTAPAAEGIEGMIEKMYAKIEGVEWPMLSNTEITAGAEGNMAYYLGVDNFDIVKGFANEPMISAIAHSVVIVEVKDGADIETIKADIKANVNPRKWICVEVQEKDVLVESEGNFICLIMVNDNSQALADAFHEVAKK